MPPFRRVPICSTVCPLVDQSLCPLVLVLVLWWVTEVGYLLIGVRCAWTAREARVWLGTGSRGWWRRATPYGACAAPSRSRHRTPMTTNKPTICMFLSSLSCKLLSLSLNMIIFCFSKVAWSTMKNTIILYKVILVMKKKQTNSKNILWKLAKKHRLPGQNSTCFLFKER